MKDDAVVRDVGEYTRFICICGHWRLLISDSFQRANSKLLLLQRLRRFTRSSKASFPDRPNVRLDASTRVDWEGAGWGRNKDNRPIEITDRPTTEQQPIHQKKMCVKREPTFMNRERNC